MRTLGIHVRSSRPRLFLLMALVPGLGCQSPAEPLADVSALNLAMGPPVQSITGSTALTVGGQKHRERPATRAAPALEDSIHRAATSG